MLTTTALALALASGGAPAGGSQTAQAPLSPAAISQAGPVDQNWIIKTGQTFVFDTTVAIVNGKPVVGGVVNVHDFTLQNGAFLRIVGPNPFVLTAWGTVTIDGLVEVSGMNSAGVTAVNTTSVPEPGAAGQAGGGHGGVGSPNVTQSSPGGGPGSGAFNAAGLGGAGGETGWSTSAGINQRRGAGGGGGAFGRNVPDPNMLPGVWDQSRIAQDVEPGFDNTAADNGALSGAGPALGGSAGPRPFVDPSRANDFYGVAVSSSGELIQGELKTPWAGAGGGAGGDASRVPSSSGTWPPPFDPFGDEKGAGGGGGAGSFHVMAMGPIVFGPNGSVRAKGGTGGGGENTIFLNRVGGGSGGGSGGHVILETAAWLDLSQVAGAVALNALGGQGGAGAGDRGGAFFSSQGPKQTSPANDACPLFQRLNASFTCLSPVDGAGGDGGPGLIQLHLREGAGALLLPPGVALGELAYPAPVCSDGSCRLLPFAVVPAGSSPLTAAASRRLGEGLLWPVASKDALRMR